MVESHFRPDALLLLAILVGAPLVLLGWGCLRFMNRRTPETPALGAKILVGTGLGIYLIEIAAIVGLVAWIGPGQSGVVARGKSPAGLEYCVVQTYKDLFEPYQVSFYIRDAQGAWRWSPLEHEDVAWRSASVDFKDGVAHVFRNGVPFKDVSLPPPGEQGTDCPGTFTVDDVLEFHNRKFSPNLPEGR